MDRQPQPNVAPRGLRLEPNQHVIFDNMQFRRHQNQVEIFDGESHTSLRLIEFNSCVDAAALVLYDAERFIKLADSLWELEVQGLSLADLVLTPASDVLSDDLDEIIRLKNNPNSQKDHLGNDYDWETISVSLGMALARTEIDKDEVLSILRSGWQAQSVFQKPWVEFETKHKVLLDCIKNWLDVNTNHPQRSDVAAICDDVGSLQTYSSEGPIKEVSGIHFSLEVANASFIFSDQGFIAFSKAMADSRFKSLPQSDLRGPTKGINPPNV